MMKDKTAIILDATSPAYAEMGGQVGDTGAIFSGSVAADESVGAVGADSRPLLRHEHPETGNAAALLKTGKQETRAFQPPAAPLLWWWMNRRRVPSSATTL